MYWQVLIQVLEKRQPQANKQKSHPLFTSVEVPRTEQATGELFTCDHHRDYYIKGFISMLIKMPWFKEGWRQLHLLNFMACFAGKVCSLLLTNDPEH